MSRTAPYSRRMVKDAKRGARSGRNVVLNTTISDEAEKILAAEVARRSKGSIRKPSRGEILTEWILERGSK